MAKAVWVSDGKIAAVGSREEVERQAPAGIKLVDLEGGTLLPGFVEPHAHLDFQVGASFYTDISPCLPQPYETRDSCPLTIVEALDFLKATPPAGSGGWILGYGLDPSRMSFDADSPSTQFTEKPAEYLDRVFPDRPVMLVDQSGHLAYANRQAFVAAGICAPGAQICGPQTALKGQPTKPSEWRVGKDDRFTGLLIEQPAYADFEKVMKAASGEQWKEGGRRISRDFARAGVTTMINGGTALGPLGLGLFERLAEEEAAAPLLRYRVLLPLLPGPSPLPKVGPSLWTGSGLYGVAGVKLWADGSLQGCTGALIEDYDPRGPCRGMAS